MSDHGLFLGKFLRHGTAIASIAPSSPWLSRTTVRNVDWAAAEVIVELGAGTGPITKVIVEKARPETRIVAIERDPDFAALLRPRYTDRPNVHIVEGDVRNLRSILGDLGIDKTEYVISGLPVPSFPKDLQRDLFRAVGEVLVPGGRYNQITELPLLYWPLYRKFFEEVRFAFEPRNLPPAGAYFCRGLKPLD